MNEDLNPGSLPEGGDGQDPTAGGEPNQTPVSVKDVLSSTLGRQFASDEAALKAVKDTFSYVGMKPQDAVKKMATDPLFANDIKNLFAEGTTPENNPSANATNGEFVSKAQYEEDMFFSKKPEYEPYKDLMRAISKSENKPLGEVAGSDTFKSVFEKAQAYDTVQKSKSVLETNPRLGLVTDKISKAREMSSAGNQVAANDAAVSAVAEAFGLK